MPSGTAVAKQLSLKIDPALRRVLALELEVAALRGEPTTISPFVNTLLNEALAARAAQRDAAVLAAARRAAVARELGVEAVADRDDSYVAGAYDVMTQRAFKELDHRPPRLVAVDAEKETA